MSRISSPSGRPVAAQTAPQPSAPAAAKLEIDFEVAFEDTQAAIQFVQGGDTKGGAGDVRAKNKTILPGAKPAFDSSDESAGVFGRSVLELVLKRFQLHPAPAELKGRELMRSVPQLVRMYLPFARAYAPELEDRGEKEIEARQRLSQGVLHELAEVVLHTVSLDRLFEAYPFEAAALFQTSTKKGKAALAALTEDVELAARVDSAVHTLHRARRAGLKLGVGESQALMSAQRQARREPEAALDQLGPLLARAAAQLDEPVLDLSQPMSAEAVLEANRPPPRGPPPSKTQRDNPAQLEKLRSHPEIKARLEAGEARVAELRSSIDSKPAKSAKDAFRGCMLGLAVGDALGATNEFAGRGQVMMRHGMVADVVGGGWLRLKPGETTDDTQMAEAMGRSIIDQKGFDQGDVTTRFVEWLNTRPKDVGDLTRRALMKAREGTPGELAGLLAWSGSGFENAGNGSVMRVAPVALLTAFQSEEEIEAKAVASSMMTHADPRCTWGAAAVSLAISKLIQGQTDVLPDVIEFLEDRCPALARALQSVPDLTLDELKPTGYVVDTVQAAFWALHHAEDYVDGIVPLINLGDDADTVGATAGMLLGARFGASGIPSDYKDKLLDRDRLAKMSDDLLGLARPKKRAAARAKPRRKARKSAAR